MKLKMEVLSLLDRRKNKFIPLKHTCRYNELSSHKPFWGCYRSLPVSIFVLNILLKLFEFYTFGILILQMELLSLLK